MSAKTPVVFISYSHDSQEHRDKVLAFADRLRAEGIRAWIDWYEQFPPEGWNARCARFIRRAEFVLIACTEIYCRRWDGEEEPGRGNGVRSEANLIRNYFFEDGSETEKFVPILFDGATEAHIPGELKGLGRYKIETGEGYDQLYWLLTKQHDTPPPEIGQLRVRPLRARPPFITSTPPARPASPPLVLEPHPRAADLFVGRSEELKRLEALLFPGAGTRRPVVVSGMAGVGKSYLVDRFYWDHHNKFPGGYLRLSLDPENPVAAAELIAQLTDRLKRPAGDEEALRTHLMAVPGLVHVENADTPEAGRIAADLADRLPGCAVVISARFRPLGSGAGWGQVPLELFDTPTAVQQLAKELGTNTPGPDWPELVAALGCLPLALHLAAGYLRDGDSAAAFLSRVRRSGWSLEHIDPADPVWRTRSRALISDTFELSLSALERGGGDQGEAWRAGFAALGHAPAAGFGVSLGAAIAGLDTDNFDDMVAHARRLSLLDRVARGAGAAYRLHPLLAELVRGKADRDAVFGRMTEWFVARLPEGEENDRGRRWNELHEESAALTEWLGQVPEDERVRIERVGSRYAMYSGPYHAWLSFCDGMLSGNLSDAERSDVLWTLGNVARVGGLPDRALAAAKEKRMLDRNRGDDHGAALAAGLIADILKMRGDFDGALRMYREEELPAYGRLGDARSAAATRGHIADIFLMRGDLDGALHLYNELLPVFKCLGAVREGAITKGQIADILKMRGDLDGALRMYREEVLPVLETLSDAREAAVTKGQIADILRMQGDLNEALRIQRQEQLPVFERLGDAHSLLTGRVNLAISLLQRGQDGDRTEAYDLLAPALAEARWLRLPEAGQIEAIIAQAGLDAG